MHAESYSGPLPRPNAADYLIASKKCELQNHAYFLQMGRLVLSISNLIHALQKERGASNIFIGSGGKRFTIQRLELIEASNLERQHFDQALHDIYSEISVHPGKPTAQPHSLRASWAIQPGEPASEREQTCCLFRRGHQHLQ